MPESQHGPDSLEGLAFQLILQKLTTLERAMQGIPPLLKKIVDHLEAQTQQPEVPMATYAQLYPELQDEGGEGQETAAKDASQAARASAFPQRGTPRRFWRWFLKEG
jgi:hypothetical protein